MAISGAVVASTIPTSKYKIPTHSRCIPPTTASSTSLSKLSCLLLFSSRIVFNEFLLFSLCRFRAFSTSLISLLKCSTSPSRAPTRLSRDEFDLRPTLILALPVSAPREECAERLMFFVCLDGKRCQYLLMLERKEDLRKSFRRLSSCRKTTRIPIIWKISPSHRISISLQSKITLGKNKIAYETIARTAYGKVCFRAILTHVATLTYPQTHSLP